MNELQPVGEENQRTRGVGGVASSVCFIPIPPLFPSIPYSLPKFTSYSSFAKHTYQAVVAKRFEYPHSLKEGEFVELAFFQRVVMTAENVKECRVQSQLVLSFERVNHAGITVARLMIPQTHALLQLGLPHAIRHGRLTIQTVSKVGCGSINILVHHGCLISSTSHLILCLTS